MNTPPTRPSAVPHRTRGFSLVESVVAIAIVSVSVLTLVGLLPGGIEDLRQSALKQAEARIIQTFVADYQMKSWGSAGANMQPQDKELYFDIRGTRISQKDTLDHAITGRATVDPEKPQLFGDKSGSNHLRRVTILISDQVQNTDAFTNPKLHHVRSAWIVNYDQTKL